MIVVFERSTGKIMQLVTAPDEYLNEFKTDTYDAILTTQDISDDTHRYEDGVFVELPQQPDRHHEFNWTTKQWVDPRTLDDLKMAKWNAAKIHRTQLLDQPLPTRFGTFDATEKARKDITDAVLLVQAMASINSSFSIDFTLANNQVVNLSISDMIEVGLALGERTQAIHHWSRVVRVQIQEATTAQELDAITW